MARSVAGISGRLNEREAKRLGEIAMWRSALHPVVGLSRAYVKMPSQPLR